MKVRLQSLILACALAGLCAAAWADDTADSFIQAIKQDNAPRIMTLLLQGADPNVRDSRGMPGLYVALQEGSLKAAQAILASPKLDLQARTPTDENALMMAALKGQAEIARALLAKGARVNKPGWSPLHYAATGGHADLVRLLLDHGADVQARSPNGTTPLMMAARYGSPEAVQLLLRAGADPRVRNVLGMDARDFAVSGKRPDLAELVTEARRRTPVRPAARPESTPAEGADEPGASPPAAAPETSPAMTAPVATPATTAPVALPPASAPTPLALPGAPFFTRGTEPDLPPPPGQAEQITPAEEPGQIVQDTPADAAPPPPSSEPPRELPNPPAPPASAPAASGW